MSSEKRLSPDYSAVLTVDSDLNLEILEFIFFLILKALSSIVTCVIKLLLPSTYYAVTNRGYIESEKVLGRNIRIIFIILILVYQIIKLTNPTGPTDLAVSIRVSERPKFVEKFFEM